MLINTFVVHLLHFVVPTVSSTFIYIYIDIYICIKHNEILKYSLTQLFGRKITQV